MANNITQPTLPNTVPSHLPCVGNVKPNSIKIALAISLCALTILLAVHEMVLMYPSVPNSVVQVVSVAKGLSFIASMSSFLILSNYYKILPDFIYTNFPFGTTAAPTHPPLPVVHRIPEISPSPSSSSEADSTHSGE